MDNGVACLVPTRCFAVITYSEPVFAASRYYGDSGAVTETATFSYQLADSIGPRKTGDPYDPATRDSKLGKNMYVLAGCFKHTCTWFAG